MLAPRCMRFPVPAHPRRLAAHRIEVIGADALQRGKLAGTAILAGRAMGTSRRDEAGVAGIELEHLTRRPGFHHHRALHAEEAVADVAVPVPRHLLAGIEGHHDHPQAGRLFQHLVSRHVVGGLLLGFHQLLPSRPAFAFYFTTRSSGWRDSGSAPRSPTSTVWPVVMARPASSSKMMMWMK